MSGFSTFVDLYMLFAVPVLPQSAIIMALFVAYTAFVALLSGGARTGLKAAVISAIAFVIVFFLFIGFITATRMSGLS